MTGIIPNIPNIPYLFVMSQNIAKNVSARFMMELQVQEQITVFSFLDWIFSISELVGKPCQAYQRP